MRLGIIALMLIFFASGAKNMQGYRDGRTAEAAEDRMSAKRKLLFGVLMLLLGVMVLIYYLVTI